MTKPADEAMREAAAAMVRNTYPESTMNTELEVAIHALDARGWICVPKEATPDMVIAGGIAWAHKQRSFTAAGTEHTLVDLADACYQAMISVAPTVTNKKED